MAVLWIQNRMLLGLSDPDSSLFVQTGSFQRINKQKL